ESGEKRKSPRALWLPLPASGRGLGGGVQGQPRRGDRLPIHGERRTRDSPSPLRGGGRGEGSGVGWGRIKSCQQAWWHFLGCLSNHLWRKVLASGLFVKWRLFRRFSSEAGASAAALARRVWLLPAASRFPKKTPNRRCLPATSR